MADEQHDDKDVVDQRDLERALAVLRPAGSQIDRDRFLFLAGRASAETVRPGPAFGRWVWPASTVLSSVAAAVLAVLLVARAQPASNHLELVAGNDRIPVPAPSITEKTGATGQVVASRFSSHPVSGLGHIGSELQSRSTEPSVAPPPADEVARALAAGSNSPRLRSFVLAYGIDALPEPAPIRQSASDSKAGDEPRTEREMLRQSLKGDFSG
jgi:hypothetical protein